MEKTNRICVVPECNTHSMYNFNGLSAIYCSSHKQPQMIDVNHVKCSFIGCLRVPSFNYEGRYSAVNMIVVGDGVL